ADNALNKLEIDKMGFDKIDADMMEAIIKTYSCGPVGLDTLAATIGEDSSTIEDVYEPYLLQRGFLNRTPRGRMATEKAQKYFG
ncbi:Holliday junction DNA helicase RuvB C-terminal domain-containing protein, partial [Treponema sp. R6D11]